MLGQVPSRSESASASAVSMLSPQRVLSATQSVAYWQRYPVAGGSHVEGSWSASAEGRAGAVLWGRAREASA
ncbi:hypothetical protein [Streptomyces longwoodensis]|uniref:hypothetical protein n=1 Tax=Streptomyces longwoodensis TaxID=68231 RepID=UPI0033EC106C